MIWDLGVQLLKKGPVLVLSPFLNPMSIPRFQRFQLALPMQTEGCVMDPEVCGHRAQGDVRGEQFSLPQ